MLEYLFLFKIIQTLLVQSNCFRFYKISCKYFSSFTFNYLNLFVGLHVQHVGYSPLLDNYKSKEVSYSHYSLLMCIFYYLMGKNDKSKGKKALSSPSNVRYWKKSAMYFVI